MKKPRLGSIDFMRTIALVIMIIANSCPYVLNTPHPVWLRFISSLAAPLFIFLSGYSFFISFKINKDYKHKYLQAIYLLISAVILDVLAWKIFPFQTFDVLYLISFGLFINILIFHINWRIKLAIAIGCILISIILQNIFGYRFINSDPMLNGINRTGFNLDNVFQFKRFLLDGWFPVLPWLSLSIFGSIIAEKTETIIRHIKIWQLISSLLFVLFSFILFNHGIFQDEREGYLELFYPPGILYLLMAFSFILFLFALTYNLNFTNNPQLNHINLLGRNSLFVYLLHTCIIAWFFDKYLKPLPGFSFSLLMILFVLFCFLIAFLMEWLSDKGMFRFLPSGIKSIIGLK